MSRAYLTGDRRRRWFNADQATCFSERTTYWKGRSVSVNTYDPHIHQELYHTRLGTWVRHEWSDQPEVPSSYTELGETGARAWLAHNGHEPVHDFPADPEI